MKSQVSVSDGEFVQDCSVKANIVCRKLVQPSVICWLPKVCHENLTTPGLNVYMMKIIYHLTEGKMLPRSRERGFY